MQNSKEKEDISDWIEMIDISILGILYDRDKYLTPHKISEYLDYEITYIKRRCKKLNDKNLLKREEQIYTISQKGEKYMKNR